ncbi:MAG: hypothetical protein ACTSRZ_15380 [Promethearchaeota archaeon]
MGLFDWIENIQFTTFAYLLIAGIAMLSIGLIGRYSFLETLGATGEALSVLTTFHWVIIGIGGILIILAILALIIFIRVS